MRSASEHHLAHSDYLRWDRDDRLKEDALKDYDAECCSECGVHPQAWSAKHGGDVRKPAVVPEWAYCHICFLLAACQKAGPPAGRDAPGWHIRFVTPDWDAVSPASRTVPDSAE